MRKVVDSNLLQSETLREYLSASDGNYVVLPDFVAMEAYKQNTLNSIYNRMEILVQYPKQVIVLKGTQIACGLNGRDAAPQERLIDETQTREFPKYCSHLLSAPLAPEKTSRSAAAKPRSISASATGADASFHLTSANTKHSSQCTDRAPAISFARYATL